MKSKLFKKMILLLLLPCLFNVGCAKNTTTKDNDSSPNNEDSSKTEESISGDESIELINPTPGIGGGEGVGYMEEVKQKEKYIFIGSSVTAGYGNNYISIADMLNDNYVKVSYEKYEESSYKQYNIYMRKVQSTNMDDKFSGVFQNDKNLLVFDKNGTGTFNDVPLTYTPRENVADVTIGGNYFSFSVEYFNGDDSYKYAVNGNTLTNGYKETAEGEEVALGTSYVDRLNDALKEHKNEKVDRVFIQLSTNDAGLKKVNFGEVDMNLGLESKNYNSNATRTMGDKESSNSTWGGLEYILSIVKETWNCKATVFVCPYFNLSGDYATNYAMMRETLISKIKPKWDIDIIDMWNDEEIKNIVTAEGATSYYFFNSDQVHPNEKGYERIFFQAFRDYLK